jgi:2-haloacid dehalogenase
VPYSTVLFDLDHTLLDSDTSERLAFGATMAEVGVDDPAQHLVTYQSLNQALWKDVELGRLSPNDVKTLRFEQLFAALDIDADAAEVGEMYLRGLGEHGELYSGALDMLHAVGEFAVLALITNGVGSVQRSRIARLGLASHFAAVAVSGELGVAKPDPRIFDHVFSSLDDPNAQTTIIVGDSLSSDIAGGHNAGIATCWFNPFNAESGPIKPTMEVTRLTQLADALRG